VAACNEEEKKRWLEDLNMAIAETDSVEGKMPYLNLKTCSKFLNILYIILSYIKCILRNTLLQSN
jgi:hypothetical protein